MLTRGVVRLGTKRKAREKGEIGLSEMQFYRILDNLAPRWRPYFITLMLTGLRTRQVCELDNDSLDHETQTILVRSTTGTTSSTVHVPKGFWAWVVAAVPVPVRYSYLRMHWVAAVELSGVEKRVSIRDLQRLRSKLLARTATGANSDLPRKFVNRVWIDAHGNGAASKDGARPELLARALPALCLSEDQERRLLLRKI